MVAPNDNNKAINQPAILSEGRHECRPKSNFHRVKNEVTARGIFADVGYGLKFRWLASGMLHQFKSHPNSLPYPFVAIAPRFCLFAYAQPAKLRLRKTQAFFSAQNDIQWFCWSVRFRCVRPVFARPYTRQPFVFGRFVNRPHNEFYFIS